MRLFKAISCLLVLFLLHVSLQGASEDKARPQAQDRLSYLDAVVLGLVEGLTEYLPISSTGHLILTNRLLELDKATPVYDDQAEPVMVMDDATGQLRQFTLGEAAYAYVIVIQAGAIAAVVVLYWRTLLDIALGCIGRSRTGRRLGLNLVVAFLPAAVIGLLLDDWIESNLGNNVYAVAGALLVGGGVMLGVERWRKHRNQDLTHPQDGPALHDLSLKQSLMIGSIQCLAMWPGTSRSMATIVGGYLAGLSPKHAAEFSFLLGLITLSAASAYKFVTTGQEMLAALDLGPVLVGCLVSFISAALAVKWMVGFLSKHGLALFAWYRIVLAIPVFLFMGS